MFRWTSAPLSERVWRNESPCCHARTGTFLPTPTAEPGRPAPSRSRPNPIHGLHREPFTTPLVGSLPFEPLTPSLGRGLASCWRGAPWPAWPRTTSSSPSSRLDRKMREAAGEGTQTTSITSQSWVGLCKSCVTIYSRLLDRKPERFIRSLRDFFGFLRRVGCRFRAPSGQASQLPTGHPLQESYCQDAVEREARGIIRRATGGQELLSPRQPLVPNSGVQQP